MGLILIIFGMSPTLLDFKDKYYGYWEEWSETKLLLVGVY